MLRSGQRDHGLAEPLQRVQRLGREPVLAVQPRRRDVDARQVDGLARLEAVLDQRARARGASRSGSAPTRWTRPPARSRPGPRRSSATSSTSAARRAAAAPWPVRSSSPSMLFRCRPVLPTNTPEPQPVELVIATALPAASTTETWLVPRGARPPATGCGRAGRSPAAARGRAPPTGRRAAGARRCGPARAPAPAAPRLRLAQDRRERAHRRRGERIARRRQPVVQRQPVRQQQAARRRRRVRADPVAAERHLHRSPPDHAVAAEVARRQRGARLVGEGDDRVGELRRGRGRRRRPRPAGRASRRAPAAASSRPPAARDPRAPRPRGPRP